MSFLRTLLMFVFVFLLVGVGGSNAGKIKNCSNCNKNKLTKLSDIYICDKATVGYPKRWRVKRFKDTYHDKKLLDDSYSYVREAKKRGLSCGVGFKSKTDTVSLCKKSTIYIKGSIYWDNQKPDFVSKAKKLGLSCNAKENKLYNKTSNQTKDPNQRPLESVTDSGGLQKEAFFLKTPCVILREETEWIELVDAKWNVVCPPKSKNKIIKTIIKQNNSIGLKRNLYGNGSSAASIVSEITKFFIKKI